MKKAIFYLTPEHSPEVFEATDPEDLRGAIAYAIEAELVSKGGSAYKCDHIGWSDKEGMLFVKPEHVSWECLRGPCNIFTLESYNRFDTCRVRAFDFHEYNSDGLRRKYALERVIEYYAGTGLPLKTDNPNFESLFKELGLVDEIRLLGSVFIPELPTPWYGLESEHEHLIALHPDIIVTPTAWFEKYSNGGKSFYELHRKILHRMIEEHPDDLMVEATLV